jgi:stage II sporulation protein AA (anti-sigma F factor antagonist)
MQPFKLTATELGPGSFEILVEGELDLAVADQLQEALDRARPEYGQILIGLEGCGFIDSTGIAVIVRAHRQAIEEGGRVAIYAPTDQVQRILAVTGLTENGLAFETRAAALAAAPAGS